MRTCDICEKRQAVEQPGGMAVCPQCETELAEEAVETAYQREETVGVATERLLQDLADPFSYGT